MSSRFYCEKSSAACIDRWKKRCAQAPSTGSADPQNTAMEHRNDAARGYPYLQPSCTCQVGVGRAQLQRIAVETTLRGAARSRQLPTATRVIWERAMGCRGAPRRATSAARAARPPAARIRAHGHHHVAKKLCTTHRGALMSQLTSEARCSLKPREAPECYEFSIRIGALPMDFRTEARVEMR